MTGPSISPVPTMRLQPTEPETRPSGAISSTVWMRSMTPPPRMSSASQRHAGRLCPPRQEGGACGGKREERPARDRGSRVRHRRPSSRPGQCPSKAMSARTGTPMPLSRAAPTELGQVEDEAGGHTRRRSDGALHRTFRRSAGAMRSSTRITLSPGRMASTWISNLIGAVFQGVAMRTVWCGSFPFLRIGTKPAEAGGRRPRQE